MKIRHAVAACAALLSAASTWALAQSPGASPDANAAASSGATARASMAHARMDRDNVIQNTTTFIQQSAQANAAAMAAAQQATVTSRSPDVRQFANRLLKAKAQEDDELRDLAAKLGIVMPTYPTAELLRTLSTLRAERGARFDAGYARYMANEHNTELVRFKRASGSSLIDPRVRRFALDSLPMMQDDLQRANQLVASHAPRNRAG